MRDEKYSQMKEHEYDKRNKNSEKQNNKELETMQNKIQDGLDQVQAKAKENNKQKQSL